ncbi:hypothetical protein ACEZDB_06815 [Streptacidiphilus sp. N1-3]|uniref:Uncharacterized protein n=1 Tax=Streptacidiphilus alkalitolerans TaxID=3342712 RepID=A0ABV6WWE8_9ACTN
MAGNGERIVMEGMYLPLGADGGQSLLRVRPGVPAEGAVLRLVMPLLRPVVRVRLLRDTADHGTVEQEPVPVVTTTEHSCTYELPIEPHDGAGDPRYLLDWEVRRRPHRHETRGDDQLLCRAQLWSGQECLEAAPLLIHWYDPACRSDGAALLRRQADSGLLPALTAEAVRAFLAACSEPVPSVCGYCEDSWELAVLSAANRAWPLVGRHGDDRAREVLARWDTAPGTYDCTNHCACHRDPCCGSGRPPGRPLEQLRSELAQARTQHRALRQGA